MWKKIKPWHIITAILVITAIILIYVNRTWIATKLGLNKSGNGNGNGNGTGTGRFGGVKTGTGTTTGDRASLINKIQSVGRTNLRRNLTPAEVTRLNSATTEQLRGLNNIITNPSETAVSCGGCGWEWLGFKCPKPPCFGGGTGV